MAKNIFLLESNQRLKKFLEERLEMNGVAVETFTRLSDLMNYLKQGTDLLILSAVESSHEIEKFLENYSNHLSRKTTPVFLIGDKFSKDEIEKFQLLGVKKIFDLPLRIDEVLFAVSAELGLKLEIDTTPSVVEAHINDDVLYVEIALGFNLEKFRLLKYRILELLELYQIKIPKIILLISDYIPNNPDFDHKKILYLLNFLVETVGGRTGWIKILSRYESIKNLLATQTSLMEINVVNSLEAALDSLMVSTDKDLFNDNLLKAMSQEPANLSLRLKYDSASSKKYRIAVVDDDFIVQEIVKTTMTDMPFHVIGFDDGKTFLNSLSSGYDLIFLDLMMPGLTGFDVLRKMKELDNKTPVIILSALNRRETVLKAMEFGVKSYLIKPLKPNDILRKCKEVLELT